MNAMRFLLFTLLALSLSLPAWAQKYGDAEIKAGKVTVLRKGSREVHRGAGKRITINHEDVIRVGRRSSMVLETTEKATITLGSNAVFQVKPWEKREKRGLFRMLFGRMRAKIGKLTGTERFNVSTATATIGVKGTEETIFSNVQGDTTVGVTESTVEVQGLRGISVAVNEGNLTGVVGGEPPGAVVPLPLEVLAALANLDSTSPTSPDAVTVPLGQVLVEAGVTTQAQVDRSEQGATQGVQLPDAPGTTGAAPASSGADNAADALESASESAQQAAQEASTVSGPISVDFER